MLAQARRFELDVADDATHESLVELLESRDATMARVAAD